MVASRMVRHALAAVAVACLLVPATGRADPAPDGDRGVSLLGRVTDACTAMPIGGAIVSVSPADPSQPPPDSDRTITNPGGHYMFFGLSRMVYVVSFAAEGYRSGDARFNPPPDGDRPGLIDASLFPPDPC